MLVGGVRLRDHHDRDQEAHHDRDDLRDHVLDEPDAVADGARSAATPAVVPHARAPATILPALGIGIAGLSSHYCLTNAFRAGDATVVVPLDFLRIPLIAVVGWWLYGESARRLRVSRRRLDHRRRTVEPAGRNRGAPPPDRQAAIGQCPPRAELPRWDPHFGHHFGASARLRLAAGRTSAGMMIFAIRQPCIAAGLAARAERGRARRPRAPSRRRKACRQSADPVCERLEAQLAAIDRGGADDPAAPSRSAATRKRPPSSRPSSTAWSRRRAGWAARAAASSRCSAASNAAMRRRSTSRSSRCAAISTASLPICSALQGGGPRARRASAARSRRARAEQLRPAIPQAAAARSRAASSITLFGAQSNAPPARSRRTGRRAALPHGLRAHLRRLLLPDLVLDRRRAASRDDEQTCQRMCPAAEACCSTPSQSRRGHAPRRCRSTASPIRRCRTPSSTARPSTRPAVAAGRPKLGRRAEDQAATTPSSTATSSSPRSAPSALSQPRDAQAPTGRRSARPARHRRRRPTAPPAAPRTTAPSKPSPIKRSVRAVGPTFARRALACSRSTAHQSKRFASSPAAGRPATSVRRRQRRAGIAEAVGDRIAAVAAEVLQRHLHARRRLPALVFGDVEQALDLHAPSSRSKPAATIAGDRLLALDQPLEDGVEHVVGRQRILVLLVLAQLGRRRPGR